MSRERRKLYRALQALEPVDCSCPPVPVCRHVLAAGYGLDLAAFAALLMRLAARYAVWEPLPRYPSQLDARAGLETFTVALWGHLCRVADPASYAEPDAVARPARAMLRYDRIEVYCSRAARGESLWAADAWRRTPRQVPDLNPVAHHLRNGALDPEEVLYGQ